MRFLTRLRSEKRSDPAERRCGHGPSRRRATVRPRLEVLEGRQVLSTLTVTSSLDGFVLPGDGTLRGEIGAARPGDTIVFDRSLQGQIVQLGAQQLDINMNLTIQGPGASLLAISGNGTRLFQVDAGANVTLSALTIEHGTGDAEAGWGGMSGGEPTYDGCGGGILNLGTMTLSGCNVTGNSTGSLMGGGGFEGGGIGNFGTMTINNCNVTSNQAGLLGSSVWAYGGGVYNNGFSTMTLSNCTVTGNSLSTQGYSYGGGVYNNGTMTLSGCTVTGNSAGPAGTSFFEGGGIGNDNQGQLTILSSVVTGNTASTGYNIANVGWISISPDSTVGQDPTGTGGKKNKK